MKRPKKIGKRCPGKSNYLVFLLKLFFFFGKFMCLLLDFDIYNVAIILSEFAWRMCGSFSSFFGWLQRRSMRIQLPFGPIFKARMEHVLRRRSAHFMQLFTFNKPKQQVKLWKKQPIFQNSSWITPGIVIMIWIHMIQFSFVSFCVTLRWIFFSFVFWFVFFIVSLLPSLYIDCCVSFERVKYQEWYSQNS